MAVASLSRKLSRKSLSPGSILLNTENHFGKFCVFLIWKHNLSTNMQSYYFILIKFRMHFLSILVFSNIYIYIYIYIYTHTHTHTQVHTQTYIYIYTQIYTFIHNCNSIGSSIFLTIFNCQHLSSKISMLIF